MMSDNLNLSAGQVKLFRPLIWVEGIIGSGKTTFARRVAERLKFCIQDHFYMYIDSLCCMIIE